MACFTPTWLVRGCAAALVIGLGLMAVSSAAASPAAWMPEAALPQPSILPAAASLDGRVYLIGGAHSASSLGSRTAIAYNPTTRRWVARAALPELRMGATAVAATGHVYVIGGDGPTQDATNSLYMFHPKQDRWSIEAAAPRASFDAPAVAVQNAAGHAAIDLFVGTSQVQSSNGVSYATYKTETYSYDTVTKTWKQLATSPGGMANGGAAGVIGGIVYLNMLTRTSPSNGGAYVNAPDDSSIGAYQSCIWTYNPAANTWSAMAVGAQPHGQTQLGAVSADGKLAVISEGPLSLSGPADDNAVEVYDPTQNGWINAPDTLAPHDQGALVTLGTRIYALGGRNPDTSTTTRSAESINTTP